MGSNSSKPQDVAAPPAAAPAAVPDAEATPATPPAECPVNHGKPTVQTGECPVDHGKGTPAEPKGDAKVKYDVYMQPVNPTNQMPFNPNQTPAVGQTTQLETNRVPSTIPKGNGDDGETWTYPSPQMFYNALQRKRKGEDVDETEMSTVVAVHNNMNETTWSRVQMWEALHKDECCAPKLTRFHGRPDDLSPKAWLMTKLMGKPMPFDRHDWYVDRCGKSVRYVIDYYYNEELGSGDEKPELHDMDSIKSISLDVRPAIDDFSSFIDRIKMPMMFFAGMESSVHENVEAMKAQAALEGSTGAFHPTVDPESLANVPEGCPMHKDADGASLDSPKDSKVPVPSTHTHSESCGCEKPSAEYVPTQFHDLTNEKLNQFSKDVVTTCKPWFDKVQTCDNEDACNKSSIALNFCMAALVCKAEADMLLQNQSDGEAYDNVTKCLERFEMKGRQVRAAQPKEVKLDLTKQEDKIPAQSQAE